MTDVALPLGFGIAASLATLLGGAVALRLAGRLTLVLGLAAGVVLGVAFFDLIPEALGMAADRYSPRAMIGCVALGFGAYMLLDRLFALAERAGAGWRPHLAPASLTLHSFLDGMGIGLAFQISPDVGWVVALAVLTHDVADGINTVSLALAGGRAQLAPRWLLVNGAAPLLGVLVGLVVQVPPTLLAPMLAGFAGVFLFIGACELMPKSVLRDPRLRTTWAILAGMALMLAVSHWAK